MLWLRRGLRIVNKSSATQTAYTIHRAVIQSYLTARVRLCRYVAKLSMNSTANGTSGSWNCFTKLNHSTAWKIGGTVTYCLFIVVSLAANSLIVMIVYKTPNLRKPINYFIANMASSDLLFPIFLIPWNLSRLHTTSLLIGGSLGQAVCKLVPFFGEVSIVVSDSYSSGSLWSRGVSTPFATHQIQAVSLFHSCHVDSCRSFHFAILVHHRDR